MDVEEGHRGGRLRSSRECVTEEHVSELGIRQTERSQKGKEFKETRRREHQELRAAGHEHMAGRGREMANGVSLTHHPGWERLVHWEG